MHCRATLVLLSWIMVGLIASAGAQVGSTGVNRTSYERGIRYRGEPFGWIATTCPADDFSGVIVYGDSPNHVTMKHNAKPVPPGPHVPAGKYIVSNDDHVYWEVGTYTIVTEARIHCLGTSPGTGRYPTNTTANVYDRIPVHSLEFVVVGAPPTASKRVSTRPTDQQERFQSDIVTFMLTLTAPAPPSDTRVRIIVDRPELFVNLPEYVRVRAGRIQETFFLELRGDVDPGTEAYVSAVTVGEPTRLLKVQFRGQ